MFLFARHMGQFTACTLFSKIVWSRWRIDHTLWHAFPVSRESGRVLPIIFFFISPGVDYKNI
jgi:hypothetical protein